MKTLPLYIFVISLFITFTMALLSYFYFRRHKQRFYSHLTELWTSLSLNALATYLLADARPSVSVLGLAGWIWPFRSFKLVLEDLSGKTLFHHWHYVVVGVAAFTTISLATFGFSFQQFTFPFALGMACVGIWTTVEAFTKIPREQISPLQKMGLLFMGLYFAFRVFFPFAWAEPAALELLVLVGLSSSLHSLFLERSNEQFQSKIDGMVRERNEKLMASSKYSELGMMSAGIAHEINNPLAVIQARTTQLLRLYKDPKRRQELSDGLQQILYTSERINRTIQGVREFVHQDERGPNSEIKLKEMMDDVLAFCGQRFKNHGVNLRFYGVEGHSIWGNKIQIEQIVLNLLNNSFDAIEYLPDKWIEVSFHEEGEKIQLLVKDSGRGIAPEIAEKMMEPFYSTKDLGKGTGLGLSLAKGIAEKHGGTLVYLSDAAHTTFKLELPRNLEQEWGMPLQ